MAKGPTKLSNLPKIENISDDDLLLVSDFDAGACVSKKMRMDQLVQHVCQGIAGEASIADMIRQTVQQAVEQALQDQIEPLVMGVVTKDYNISAIADLMDGDENGVIAWDGND